MEFISENPLLIAGIVITITIIIAAIILYFITSPKQSPVIPTPPIPQIIDISPKDSIGVFLSGRLCKTISIFGELNDSNDLTSEEGIAIGPDNVKLEMIYSAEYNVFPDLNKKLWSVGIDMYEVKTGDTVNIKVKLTKGEQTQIVDAKVTIPPCKRGEGIIIYGKDPRK